MLDAFIIEELRRREESERSHVERPRLELPLEEGREKPAIIQEEGNSIKNPDRGIIIIDF